MFLESESENLDEVIQGLLEVLINNIDSDRSEFEYIYQRIAEYYRDKTKPLQKEKIIKFTNILRVNFKVNPRFSMGRIGIQAHLGTIFTFLGMGPLR